MMMGGTEMTWENVVELIVLYVSTKVTKRAMISPWTNLSMNNECFE
jgi:hypothetical protein